MSLVRNYSKKLYFVMEGFFFFLEENEQFIISIFLEYCKLSVQTKLPDFCASSFCSEEYILTFFFMTSVD